MMIPDIFYIEYHTLYIIPTGDSSVLWRIDRRNVLFNDVLSMFASGYERR